MTKRIIAFILALALMPVFNIKKAAAAEVMKGVWVSTVANLDYPQNGTVNSAQLMKEADEILDNCKSMGFNAIFFQVRPASDAFYKSDIFPYSQWLTGSQGTAPENGFDPLSYWVDGAHKRGMELHAWINPYRITTNGISLDALAFNNPARINKNYTIHYTNGNYYYNPAMPEVRQLVIDGVMEIVNNYDVDGIHFDDYFYPGSDIEDDADYAKYNTAFDNKADWRRNNCDLLVKGIHDSLAGKNVAFGISPSGIWANKSNNPLGSDTGGFESYSAIFADTRKWALNGWIDYIAPQVYWQIGHSVADYETVTRWWANTLASSGTKLYIGIGEYRCDDADSDSVWYNGAEISRQLAMNKTISKVGGEIHFRYGSIIKNDALKTLLTAHNGGTAAQSVQPQPVTQAPQPTTQAPVKIEEPTVATTQAQPTAPAISKDDIVVYLDGEMVIFDQKPIIENGRTLVPMRAIFEALGMTVEWNNAKQRITATDPKGTLIIMTIGDKIMTADGKIVEMDVPPKIVASRTLVPLRAISEAYNCKVEWDGVNRIINITS
ncbi:MAG: family 10 glycosylhydrolase [Firmicutes bacterium]|nr:family 10 glycosylhydrolase [Bacillota bacterium]